jgi:hypothetical protein
MKTPIRVKGPSQVQAVRARRMFGRVEYVHRGDGRKRSYPLPKNVRRLLAVHVVEGGLVLVARPYVRTTVGARWNYRAHGAAVSFVGRRPRREQEVRIVCEVAT